MTAILGISAFYHDSAAALVIDGRIVAASQEERFSRLKGDAAFPVAAIESCLDQAGLGVEDLDYVGFYEKPLLKFDRLLDTYLSYAPEGHRSFQQAMPGWLGGKLRIGRQMRLELGGKYRKRFLYCQHHQAHAASAFYPSPFEVASILTIDGVGEWATTTIGVGRGERIELLREIRFPHSLGLLYSAFTAFCGFRVNSGEYKLMGLAPLGQPRFTDLILEKLVDVKPDGSFRLDMRYFSYCQRLMMTSPRFHRLFAARPRSPEEEVRELDRDLAASIQRVAEIIIDRLIEHLVNTTGCRDVCLAGGVALNCVANGRLIGRRAVDRLWVQPAAGDAGGSLGVAMMIWHQWLGNARVPMADDAMGGALLGPAQTTCEIRQSLAARGAHFTEMADDQLDDRVAQLLADGKVVAWVQGRMEFGPRSLGNRSILADPRSPSMQQTLNRKVKRRESFRPFAPAVLSERVHEDFDVPRHYVNPYMTAVVQVRREGSLVAVGSGSPSMSTKPRAADTVPRALPAVTHRDHSARVQTVDRERFPRFYRLLEAFDRRTGCPVLINTSFNVRGEPIVNTAEDAHRCLMATEIDALAIDRFLLLKRDQPAVEPVWSPPAVEKPRPLLASPPPPRWLGASLALVITMVTWTLLAGWLTMPLLLAIQALALTLAIVYHAHERSQKRIAHFVTWITSPVRRLLLAVALWLLYYGVLTPIGVSLRWLGRDPLNRSPDPAAESYWHAVDSAHTVEDAFRLY